MTVDEVSRAHEHLQRLLDRATATRPAAGDEQRRGVSTSVTLGVQANTPATSSQDAVVRGVVISETPIGVVRDFLNVVTHTAGPSAAAQEVYEDSHHPTPPLDPALLDIISEMNQYNSRAKHILAREDVERFA